LSGRIELAASISSQRGVVSVPYRLADAEPVAIAVPQRWELNLYQSCAIISNNNRAFLAGIIVNIDLS
jgi:hypothetical protein